MYNYKLLSDEPTIDDRLGYQKVADTLAKIILGKSLDTPITIGIFGEWGTGKTSLLRMVEERIQGPSYHTIWFDPWRYDEKNIIQTALIQTILAKIDKDAESNAFREQVVELTLKFLALVASKTIQVGTSGVVKPLEIYAESRDMIKSRFDYIRAWNEIDQAFAKVVKAYVGKDGRLVVFIDDLDRCLPENAIQVLEAIKLFLAQENCIFILSVDKQCIEDAISSRYNHRMSGVNYLEKIIQLPLNLPRPQPENISAYTKKLLGETGIHQVQYVIDVGAGGNPRRIKRFINIFTLLHSVAPNANLNQVVLAKLVMIQMRFPDFYELLCNDSKAVNNLMSLNRGEKSRAVSDNDAYSKHLSNIDLINFLIRTQDINPEHDSWGPYLYLTEMVNI